LFRLRCICFGIVVSTFAAVVPATLAQQQAAGPAQYLNLTKPQLALPDAQTWEGKEFPHTMSVLEVNRDGFRYWGWYGLNEGRGIGLARSNDLLHWTKYEQNPLWTNARWPSVLEKVDPKDPGLLYFAITRDYDTPSSYVVLAISHDGIHLTQEKVLAAPVPNQRNQNPNLFRDPVSGRYFLTFYRGNDNDHFEIISKSAATVTALDKAPEKVLFARRKRLPPPRYFTSRAKARKEEPTTWLRRFIRIAIPITPKASGK
jgi:hypothetical protein